MPAGKVVADIERDSGRTVHRQRDGKPHRAPGFGRWFGIPVRPRQDVVVLVLHRHDIRVRQLPELLVERCLIWPVPEPVGQVEAINSLPPVVARGRADHLNAGLPEAVGVHVALDGGVDAGAGPFGEFDQRGELGHLIE